jgi:hypothetical protein
MKFYKSKEGYYYKIYKNGKKKRISQKEYKNKTQRGGYNLSDLITSLQDISKQINNIYKSEDKSKLLFLCLGATPAYLYTYLKKCYSYNVINIPISGLSLIFKHNYYPKVSAEENKKFCDYLNKYLGLLYRSDMRKLICIDLSYSGKSISNFINLINECTFKFDEIDFCNLVDNITPMVTIKQPSVKLNNIHIIKADGINDMAGHIIYPRATLQTHFTTIVKSTPEEINSIILDTSSIKDGLKLQKDINDTALCDNV